MFKIGDVITFDYDRKCGQGVVVKIKDGWYFDGSCQLEVYLLGRLAGTGHEGSSHRNTHDYWYVKSAVASKTDNRIIL